MNRKKERLCVTLEGVVNSSAITYLNNAENWKCQKEGVTVVCKLNQEW